MTVDFRSDTVTRPSPGMLEVMMRAETGDDVFGEDPTVNRLEAETAALFGHEAALFCASGTMANQIALKAQTQPMDEIIAHELCHIYYYETAGYAFNSGVSIRLVRGNNGLMTAHEVAANIQADRDWLPRTSLVTLENTCNKGGGSCYDFGEMEAISELCRQRGLRLHLDGARFFNAAVARGYGAAETGPLFDTVSICFSKGLGAPVGSVLIGSRETVRKARRIRKVFGGGMRQAGILAAACLYALEHHIDGLADDHRHADRLASALRARPWVASAQEPETNIVLFDVAAGLDVETVVQALEAEGLRMMAFGPRTVRAITHRDLKEAHIDHATQKIGALTL